VSQSAIREAAAPIRKLLPTWLFNPIHNILTAILTPILYSMRTGHFRSSLRMAAVSRHGEPIPWYTYPCVDFLSGRTYTGKKILEFGGGQSTQWWSARAEHVVTFEGKKDWYDRIAPGLPPNVELHYVERTAPITDGSQVAQILSTKTTALYDVIVIDGLTRAQLIDIACERLAPNGIIICDNSETYGFYEGFKDKGLDRIDFFGNAPGVIHPHCTSIYFRSTSFVFCPSVPIDLPA
jgi:hypothetical protein